MRISGHGFATRRDRDIAIPLSMVWERMIPLSDERETLNRNPFEQSSERSA